MLQDAAPLDAAYTVNLLLNRIRNSLIERNAIPLDALAKNGPSENASIHVTELLIGADDKVVWVKRMDDSILDNTLLEIGDSMMKILPTREELPSVAYDTIKLMDFSITQFCPTTKNLYQFLTRTLTEIYSWMFKDASPR